MTNNEWGFITLPTHADPEQRAIARLKLSSEMSLEHYKTPLLLTHSGGKDSCVLTELALRAEIPFEVLHAHTTADAPETVHFVRSEFARLENRGIRCSINYPLYKGRRTSMWDLIPRKLTASDPRGPVLLRRPQGTKRQGALPCHRCSLGRKRQPFQAQGHL